jgi:hypothetical protein
MRKRRNKDAAGALDYRNTSVTDIVSWQHFLAEEER